MSKSSVLYQLMTKDLPTRTFQKRLRYRTNHREVVSLFKVINREIFHSRLPIPEIHIMPRCRTYWGICIAKGFYSDYDYGNSNCIIRLSDKWFCRQWLITTLAHEMCHQYQWDIDGHKRIQQGKAPLMSHGPSFFKWRDKLERHGVPLKRAHGMRRWFKHQSMFKC